MEKKGIIRSINSNLLGVHVEEAVAQNEICYVNYRDLRLMGEVIKVTGKEAFVQVFDSTRGLCAGNEVYFSGRMLEATLGPGILSSSFDGLQNDLDKIEKLFLDRGTSAPALDESSNWDFAPIAQSGDQVTAGDWLGEVPENWVSHKIMVPFEMTGNYQLEYLAPTGNYLITDTIAVLKDENGTEFPVSMLQKWPIKKPIKAYQHKPRPERILETGIRSIDTLNPIAEGGTGFIPGPFGCGKTVLQHSISQNANADMIIFAACGERANEVVNLFIEFPELDDPHTGRKLIERTTIICNTSNMPVAAREASVYTAMTLAEYYRAMGLKVLLLADSTSRWAQALREMSNRLEELPGPDAYPVDLNATIANYYSRAGMVYLNNGQTGSITFIGTVSPAGGNLKEPVTEATRKAARCFYSLVQQRADRKRYPAIDPVDSYSKYLEYPEVQNALNNIMGEKWINLVSNTKDRLRKGKEAFEQINILGDDGVPITYHEDYWKAELIDFVILQQDAFDDIDKSTPLERQKYMLQLVMEVCNRTFPFNQFDQVAPFFKNLIYQFRQMNYSAFNSEKFQKYEQAIRNLITEPALS